MTDKRRSPYLVLGVRFGTSKTDAQKAFARATRRLRRLPNAPFDIEDLNWALHAVEQRLEDPSVSIDDYRMPADATVYEAPVASGVLSPAGDDVGSLTLRASVVREVIASKTKGEVEGAPLPALHRFTQEGL